MSLYRAVIAYRYASYWRLPLKVRIAAFYRGLTWKERWF